MRKFIHTIIFKISKLKLPKVIEIGAAPSETTWK